MRAQAFVSELSEHLALEHAGKNSTNEQKNKHKNAAATSDHVLCPTSVDNRVPSAFDLGRVNLDHSHAAAGAAALLLLSCCCATAVTAAAVAAALLLLSLRLLLLLCCRHRAPHRPRRHPQLASRCQLSKIVQFILLYCPAEPVVEQRTVVA